MPTIKEYAVHYYRKTAWLAIGNSGGRQTSVATGSPGKRHGNGTVRCGKSKHQGSKPQRRPRADVKLQIPGSRFHRRSRIQTGRQGSVSIRRKSRLAGVAGALALLIEPLVVRG